jgi:predicted ATP-binding protein involved in virulence
MRIQSLELNNFRKYKSSRFNFHEKFTVLIGNNGAGKTTVLDAIAILLNTYFQGAKIQSNGGAIKKSDARQEFVEKAEQVFAESQSDVFLDALAIVHDHTVGWRREVGDRGGKAKKIVEIGAADRRELKSGGDPDLPLLLYYGAGRLWATHHDTELEKPSSQLDGYRFCLDPKSDQKAFSKWFKKLSLVELQKRKEVPGLTAVKNAVLVCTPGASDFYFDVDYGQIFLNLKKEGLMPFEYLSDGFRNVIAMVADIAHRAARLNPHYGIDAAIKTKGVVLIDELDLHLHPKWQRRIVDDLKEAFPGMQFIATTHSPFILQSLQAGEVIDLDRKVDIDLVVQAPLDVAMPAPQQDFSNRALEDIVEEVMHIDVPQRGERYQEMYDVAKEYYLALQDSKHAGDKVKEELKIKLDELSAPFSENVAYHAFLEMERAAAGLGRSKTRQKNQTHDATLVEQDEKEAGE